jgi:hypothetical protein
VNLSVFDVNGRVITTLVDETQDAGRKTVTWNSGNAASGVYFYTLRAGDFVKTEKMVLTK